MNFVYVLIILFAVYEKIENNSHYLLRENLMENFSFPYPSLVHFVETFLTDQPITILYGAADSGALNLVFKQISLPISIINMWCEQEYFYFEATSDTTSNYIILWGDQVGQSNVGKLELTIINLKSLINWNRNAKYLILIKNRFGITPTIKLFWKHNVYNMVIAVMQDQSFYTWYPYEVENNCGTTVTPHAINLLKRIDPFRNKVPKNLNRCPLKLGWYSTEFLMHDPEGKNPAAGNEFFAAFTQIRNLTLVYKYKPIYHVEALNGATETHDLDMKNKEIDVSSFTKGSAERYMKYDLSDTVFEMMTFWVLPQPTRIPLWKSMIMIFRKEIWITLMGSLMFTSLIWWGFGYILHKHQDITMSTMTIGSIFLGISVANPPKGHAQKIVFIFSFSIYLTVIVGYVSRMGSFLIHPLYEPKLTNIQEIAGANLQLKFIDVNFDELVDGLDEETTKLIILKHVSTTLHPKEQLEDFLMNPTYAAAITDVVLFNKLRDPSKIEKVYEKRWMPLRLVFVLPKGHPLIHRLNYMINLCHEAGLFKKWMQNSYLKTEKLEISTDVTREHPLTINDLQLGFGVLIVGLVISMLVFIFQLLPLLTLKHLSTMSFKIKVTD